MIPRSLQHKISTIVDFIYNHESEFLDRFLGEQFTDIISVSIGGERIEFVALADCGQSVSYDCSIEEYNKWFLSFPEKDRTDFYHNVKRKKHACIK